MPTENTNEQQGNFFTPEPNFGGPNHMLRSDNINHSGNQGNLIAGWPSNRAMEPMAMPMMQLRYPVVNSLQTMYNPMYPNFPAMSMQNMQGNNQGPVNNFKTLQQKPPGPDSTSIMQMSRFGLDPATQGSKSSQSSMMYHNQNFKSFDDVDKPSREGDISETDELNEINEGVDSQSEVENVGGLNKMDKWHRETGSRGISRPYAANVADKEVESDPWQI